MSDERDRLDIEVRKVAELERLLAVARAWRKCPLHGDIDGARQWGCPDCVAELRSAKRQLEAEKAECAEALRQAEYAHVTRLEICDDLRHKLATAKESLREALSALSHAKMFIEYARYELEPGLATGDQFPRQEDADKEIKNIDAAIEKLKRTEGM